MIGFLLGGRYRIERILRQGAAAVVYEAWDVSANRRVAVKTLRDEMAQQVGRERFLREMRIAAEFTHPHILSLHDSGDHDGTLYYVMPFVSGESLRERLTREGQLPIEEAVQFGREIADALQYAHDHGVIHRDIKPENVLLEAGHAVVADFGIARVFGAVESEQKITWTGGFVGTPGYMSPEQSNSDGVVDARCDQYALGCILYEMVSGRPVFEASTVQGLFNLHRDASPRSLAVVRPTIPPLLDSVVAQALAKAPADRFESARQLERALRLVPLDRTSTEIRAVSAGFQPVPIKRNPRVVRGIVVALGVAGLGLAVWAGTRFWRPEPADALIALAPISDSAKPSPGRANELAREMAQALTVFADIRPVRSASLERGTAEWADESLTDVLRDARRMGARYLLRFGSTGGSPRSRFRAELYVVNGRHLVTAPEYESQAASDGLTARAALDILRAITAQEGDAYASRRLLLEVSGTSLSVAHLEEWRRLMSVADFRGAAESAERAVAVDSLNPLARYRLSVARYWLHDFVGAYRATLGWRRADASSSRWRALLDGQRNFLTGRGDSAITLFQTSLADLPANVDGWLGLGESIFHYGWLRGRPQAESRSAFAHMISLEGTFVPVYDHLFDMSFYAGDTAGARGYLAKLVAIPDEYRPRQIALAWRYGSPAAQRDAVHRLDSSDRKTLSIVFRLFATRRFDAERSETVARVLATRGALDEDRLRGVQYALTASMGMPNERRARDDWSGARQSRPYDAWRVTLAFAAPNDSGLAIAQANATDRFLERSSATPSDWNDPAGDVPLAALLVAQAKLLWPLAIDGKHARLRAEAAERTVDPTNPGAHTVVRTFAAAAALERADTASAVALLEDAIARVSDFPLVFTPPLSLAPQRLVLAMLLRRDPAAHARYQELVRSFDESLSLTDPVFALLRFRSPVA
jgi:tRNA A-37 threonylcarbamoyl transferase component Bud32